MIYTYHVEFETDPATENIIVFLPSLNYTSDFGSTVEDALKNLKKLAEGFIEVLEEQGKPIPPSDPITDGLYLSLGLKQTPLAT
ncbi:MAG: type II toxin-antitoxin system HicB family antitoxin [Candidatus Brocadia sp.]|nr:type II toxin-antitoxin system HicB family antitoxin [Candidatus Brocadia sp.]UJS15938.1 MAG: type II toxin-antitoxin system HicB family antitoxin [Candidatus Jettenia sp.]